MSSHDHSHGDTGNIRLAFFLNVSFAIVEIIGGLATNSIAILSDALHDLGDSISLGLAWFLQGYAEKASDRHYSYGYRRYSLLGAFINSVILVGGSLFVLSEAVQRLQSPQPFEERGMIAIAVVGIIANGIGVLRLRGSGQLNTRVLSWHLMEDVLGWVAILIVGVISLFIDVPILDPILSILVTLYILSHAVNNLRKSAELFLQATPQGVDLEQVERRLLSIEGVESIHHTHIWSLDGENNVLTTHLVVKPETTRDQLLRIKRDTRVAIEDLHLAHETIEIEYSDEAFSPEAAYLHQ